jgi:hypothetical protein
VGPKCRLKLQAVMVIQLAARPDSLTSWSVFPLRAQVPTLALKVATRQEGRFSEFTAWSSSASFAAALDLVAYPLAIQAAMTAERPFAILSR